MWYQNIKVKSEYGLTAVEIVLALALLLLISGLVIGNLDIPLEKDAPRGSVEEVMLALIQEAHVLARTRHEQVEMEFDREGQQMVLVALPSGQSWNRALPSREEEWEVEFWRVSPDSSLSGTINLELEENESRRLVFHPWGGSSPVMIRIRQGMSEDLELWVEPFSAHLKQKGTSL